MGLRTAAVRAEDDCGAESPSPGTLPDTQIPEVSAGAECAAETPASPVASADSAPPPPPLPRMHLLIVSVCMFVNAVHLTVLYPFLFFMVRDFSDGEGDERDVGYAAGLIAGAIMMGRAPTAVLWGRVADRIGRLPVLYVGLGAIAILGPAFGFTRSEWQAIAVRFVAGLFGTIVTIGKVLASEVCPAEHQARAMSFVGVSWGCGSIVGPAVGGALTGLWPAHPYAAPMLLCSVVAMGALLLARAYLPETLPPAQGSDPGCEAAAGEPAKSPQCCSDAPPRNPTQEPTAPTEAPPRCCPWGSRRWRRLGGAEGSGRSRQREPGSLLHFGVLAPVLVYSVWSFVQIGIAEVANVWAPTSIANGGLEFTRHELSIVNSLTGLALMGVNPLLFPTLVRRWGIVKTHNRALLLTVPLLIVIPQFTALTALPRPVLITAFIAVYSAVQVTGLMAMTAQFMMHNNATYARKRAQVQGLAMSASSVWKALGPVCFGSILARSLAAGVPYVPWLCMAATTLAALAIGTRLPESLERPFEHPGGTLSPASPSSPTAPGTAGPPAERRPKRSVAYTAATQWSARWPSCYRTPASP
eukprot:TRINITY_DN15551_c0_g1_i2.p1 TRINITY_DN15551_c0_g1~~TRINITY_DN15551_c0_g1_i2.p1  ORF type:complete len:585 (+),score=105.16 TRINITY_DN15551_c0_g1_i2:78-1832(+)